MKELNFPVLGQALPVELANTYYFGGGLLIEGLASVADARDWVRVNAEPLTVKPSEIDEACRTALVELRESVRELLAAVVERRPPAAAALARVNDAAARRPAHLALRWAAGRPRAERRRAQAAGAAERLRADIADAVITLVAGEDADWVRACPAPGCIGFFVKDHPRREWCSTACGNRARNARFHQRHIRAGRRAGR